MDTLQKRFDGALIFLKKQTATINGKKRQLATLPWQLIIGMPGSGKTSMLANADLPYLLSKKMSGTDLSNPPTTKHCHWWVTRESVYLETPGSYMKDHKNWESLAQLIKKNKTVANIQNILLIIDIKNINNPEHLKYLKNSITNLTETIKKCPPISIAINKCDTIPGFNDFFAADIQAAQEKNLGFAIEHSDAEYDFDQFIKTLQNQTVWRMHQQGDVNKRMGIQTFPTELATRHQAIQHLINRFSPEGIYFCAGQQVLDAESLIDNSQIPKTLKRPSLFVHNLLATLPNQQSNFISPLTFSLNPLSWFKKIMPSSFLTKQRNDTAIKKGGHNNLPSSSKKNSKQNSQATLGINNKSVITKLLLGIFVIIAVTFIYIYHGQKQAMEMAQSNLINSQKIIQNQTKPDLATLLDQVEHLTDNQNLIDKSQYIFAPEKKSALIDKNKKLIADTINQKILPLIASLLESRLQTGGQSATSQYATLSAYLMMINPSHANSEFLTNATSTMPQVNKASSQNKEILNAIINLYIDQYQTSTSTQQHEQAAAQSSSPTLQKHNSDITQTATPAPKPNKNTNKISRENTIFKNNFDIKLSNNFIKYNKSLVNKARNQLKTLSLIQLAYIILQNQIGNQTPKTLITFNSNQIQWLTPQTSTLTLQYMFTKQGFDSIFNKQIISASKAALEGNLVLGSNTSASSSNTQSPQSIAESLKKLYIYDYLKHWDNLLQSFTPRTPSKLKDTQALINVLIKKDSIFRQTINLAYNNTSFLSPNGKYKDYITSQAPGDINQKTFDSINSGLIPALENLNKTLSSNQDDTLDYWTTQVSLASNNNSTNQINSTDSNQNNSHNTTGLLITNKPQGNNNSQNNNQQNIDSNNISSSNNSNDNIDTSNIVKNGSQTTPFISTNLTINNPTVNSWVNNLLTTTWIQLTTEATKTLQAKWSKQINNYYTQRLAKGYPFTDSSKLAVKPEYFNNLYSDLLPNFASKYINPLTTKDRNNNYHWKTPYNHTLGLSTQSLKDISLISMLTKTIFPSDPINDKLGMQFTAMSLDADTSKFSIKTNNKYLDLTDKQPSMEQKFTWNNSKEDSVTISFTDAKGKTESKIYKGQWAWMQLLQKSLITKTDNPNEYIVIVSMGQHFAKLALSTPLLLTPEVFSELTVPDSLIGNSIIMTDNEKSKTDTGHKNTITIEQPQGQNKNEQVNKDLNKADNNPEKIVLP